MSRLYLLASIVLLPCLSTFAADQTTASEPQTTIHATSDLVVIDVTVTDRQQNAVHHLTADDFKIYEDGQLQTIKNFEEHSAPTTPPPLTPMPKLEEGTYTNFTPAPASGPLTILLLDTLNTPMVDQITVRNQLLKFLKQAQPGTEIAIFVMGTQLRLIKGFTTDLDQLRAIMEKAKPDVSPLLDTVASITALGSEYSDAQNPTQIPASQVLDGKTLLRAEYTIDMLRQLQLYLSSLPGRKNLIWFSGSFPLDIWKGDDPTNPASKVVFTDEIKDTLSMMSHGQVAIYPVDALGLRTDPMYDPESNGGMGTSGGLPGPMADAPGAAAQTSSVIANTQQAQVAAISKQQQANIQAINDSHSAFNVEMTEAYDGMRSVAEATGGKAFINSNDLAGAIQKAIADGANYYTIAYAPTKPPQNGYYRKIKVETDHKGVSLAYRRGYYSFDRSKQNQASAEKAAKNEAALHDPLNAAMMRGAPAPTQIMLLVSARPTTAAPEPAPAPDNKVEPKVKGPFRRYTIRYNVAADNLDCPATPDGMHHCSLQILALVYDSYRGLVNTQINGVKLSIPPARYAEVLSHGIELKQEVSVPTEDGTYFLRTGVKDVTSGRIGALEIPIAEAAKLTPVSVTKP